MVGTKAVRVAHSSGRQAEERRGVDADHMTLVGIQVDARASRAHVDLGPLDVLGVHRGAAGWADSHGAIIPSGHVIAQGRRHEAPVTARSSAA